MTCILLTEDEADQRELYHQALEDAGYKVWDARSAVEALELYERFKPHLVILDICMTGMDGIEALGRIVVTQRKTPVIFYSAYPAFKDNFLTWTADAFVEKTGDPQELLNAVNKVSLKRGVPIPEPVQAERAVSYTDYAKFIGGAHI